MARPIQSSASIAAKRDEILIAAQEVLESNRSVDAVTLRAVAKVLNWSYSAAYRYFSSKEEMLIALREQAFRWMEEELRSAVLQSDSAIRSLERLTQAYIAAGMRRPDLYQMMFFEIAGPSGENVSASLLAAKRDCLGVCDEVMARAQRTGELSDEIDSLTAAHMFWVSAHGIVSLQIGGQLVMGREVNEITHAMVNIVIGGLASPQQSSQFFIKPVLYQSKTVGDGKKS